MPHETALIATIAVGLGLAFILGYVASKLRLPALIGYLLAGIVVGPFTPGFVADGGLASQLAEIGVILLMFGVGLHFSFEDLLAVKNIALPGAVAQIAVATALGAAVTHWWWGWSIGASVMFGLSLSVASTVVLLKALEERGAVDSVDGRIAIGWLIVEDLAMVLALVLLPVLAGVLGGTPAGLVAAATGGGDSLAVTLGLTLGKVALFVALMVVVGRRVAPWMLAQIARTGSRELFTLSILAVALGVAFGSAALFGVSFALGAFFAGVVVSESDLSHRVADQTQPLQDAFAVLFFVSVGMLFDPSVLWARPLEVLAVVGIIVLGKSVAAAFIVLAFGYPLKTALTVSASLAQVGEFSFILVALGMALGLMPAQGQSLILAGALLSITLNPVVFWTVDPLLRWFRKHPEVAERLEHPEGPLTELPAGLPDEALQGHAVIVGYGRVGNALVRLLEAAGMRYVVVEQNRELVERLRAEGKPAIYGDACVPAVLAHAHLERAAVLLAATSDALQARQMLELARAQNPTVRAIARAHSKEEHAHLTEDSSWIVVDAEEELATAMARLIGAAEPAGTRAA